MKKIPVEESFFVGALLALSGGLGLAAVGAALWWGGDAGMRFLLLAGWVGSNFLQKVLPHPCHSRRFPVK